MVERLVTTSVRELHDRIRDSYLAFASVVAEVESGLPVDGSWTARDVVAHVLTVVNRYTDFDADRLADDPREVDEINRRELAALATVPITELADRLEAEMARFGELWGPGRGPADLDMPLPFHAGATIDLRAALENLVGEFRIHGLDLAVAAGAPWAIDERDALLLVDLCTQLFPYYVRAAAPRPTLVRLDADGAPGWVFDLGPEQVVSRPASAGDRPDLVVVGSAAAVALTLYARDPVRAGVAPVAHIVASGAAPLTIGELMEEP